MSEAQEQELPFWRWSNPILWGIGLTVIVGVCAAVLAFFPSCSTGPDGGEHCRPKWFSFLNASPNEVGDTLAGFAGVLAFIWIIVTVAIQAEELKLQRKELSLTRAEFRKMADAQQGQLRVLSVQEEIFRQEMKARSEQDTVELLNAKIRYACRLIADGGLRQGTLFSYNQKDSVDVNALELHRFLMHGQTQHFRPNHLDQLKTAEKTLSEVAQLFDQLPPSQQFRYRLLQLDETRERLAFLLEVWAKQT